MAYIATTFHGDGRGGEVQYIRLSEFRFDPLLNCTICGWRESKNLMKYAMSLVHCKYARESYLIDVYFNLFCFIIMTDGLWRGDATFTTNGGSDSLFSRSMGKKVRIFLKYLQKQSGSIYLRVRFRVIIVPKVYVWGPPPSSDYILM